jgi:hypothetical protein
MSKASPAEYLPNSGNVKINQVDLQNYLEYNDQTNVGLIKFFAQLEDRALVLNRISEICNSKNIAIHGNQMPQSTNAVFTTLDEKFSNNIFQIKFECVS